MAAAHLSGSPGGQKDLAEFAPGLSQSQGRAVGIRRRAGSRGHGAPEQPTFSRMMAPVGAGIVDKVPLDWQEATCGPVPDDEITASDGKVTAQSCGKIALPRALRPPRAVGAAAGGPPSAVFEGLKCKDDGQNSLPPGPCCQKPDDSRLGNSFQQSCVGGGSRTTQFFDCKRTEKGRKSKAESQ